MSRLFLPVWRKHSSRSERNQSEAKQIQRNPTQNNVHTEPLQPYHVATDNVWSELTQSAERRRPTVQARTAPGRRKETIQRQQATAIRFPANDFLALAIAKSPVVLENCALRSRLCLCAARV